MTWADARTGFAVLGVALAGAAPAACGGEPSPSPPATVAPANGEPAEVGCEEGGPAPRRARRGDLPMGPFVLIGIDESGVPPRHRQTGIDRPPGAFGGNGYKIPVSLPNGTSAVMAVPRFEHGRLALVFTLEAQERVLRDGVAGGDRAVRFTACPAGDRPGRTGWPGGFAVDEPHCATLTVDPARTPVTNFGLPLGRPCPPPR